MNNDNTETVENKEVEEVQEAKEEKHSEKTFTRSDIAKMISAEKEKWEAEKQEEIEQAKTEAERLAKLSKSEREKEEQAKRLADLDKREKEIAMKELRLATRETLASEGLPEDFLDVVMGDSAEQIQENIKHVRNVFDAAVEKKVDERLAQGAPKQGVTGSGLTKDQIMSEKDSAKRLQLIAENRNLFNQKKG